MRAADYLIDIGPDAGRLGGRVVYAGPSSEYSTTGKAEQEKLLAGILPTASVLLWLWSWNIELSTRLS